MGGLLFACMLGLINYLHCEEKQVLDIVPVDYVSNLILCATVYTAKSAEGSFNIVHSSSSKHQPITIM
jgi:hypothetical protein